MLEDKIIKKYIITYNNEISQTKVLISQEDYNTLVKPKLNEIILLESELVNLGRKNKKRIELEKLIKEIESSINIGEFFTTESPLGQAINSNYLEFSFYKGNITFKEI